MPMFCAVYGCSNRSNREKGKGFYRVPKVVVHKGEKCQKLTELRRKTWISNLNLQSRGAESPNARVCSDHFIRGCPSALGEVDSVDWAPTINLGYPNTKTKSEASVQREQKIRLTEEQQRRLECAETMLDLQQTADGKLTHQGHADTGYQTELTVEDIRKVEDVQRQNTTELGDLQIKAPDKEFKQEPLEKNGDKTKFCTGPSNFLVFIQIVKL